jgi:membrane protein DedA with SNARE-associated domain
MDGQGSYIVALLDALRAMDGDHAFFAILAVLGLCGLGLPMPEDVILLTAGYLASLGKFSLGSAIAAGMVGVLTGDAVLFFLGHHYGRAMLTWPGVQRWFGVERLRYASERIQERGRFICFIARFLPGLRSPIYVVAGAMGVPPRTYMLQDGLAASISVPFWVVMGWAFGGEIEAALRTARQVQTVLLAVVVSVVLWQLFKWWRGRNAPPAPPGDLEV